ncbi:MAG: cysteine synthase A [Candidatus Omnitrophica bacterium 4484_70.2]|nr:MAG: cysteine synthase A [Candidatus Omnitrophica bacterium 4484_70.2]
MKPANNIFELVGKTPIVKLRWLSQKTKTDVFAKLEFFNPFFSIKDRVAWAMIEEAEKKGLIKKNTTIIEATSGNTGVALAGICRAKGYKVIIVMPDNVPRERIRLLNILGAQVILTPAEKGMEAALKKVHSLTQKISDTFVPDQFKNLANPRIHEYTTAREIQQTMRKVDVIICGIGTAGTITGIARFFKKRKKKVRIVGVEPQESAVLSGGCAGKHKIFGIGAGFIPPLLERELIDEIVAVSDKEAIEMSRKIAYQEAILCGISSGAVACAVLKIARKKKIKGKRILLIFADSLERYLSFL